MGSTVAKRNERLVKLLDGVGAMNLGSVKDHDIGAFGDAYEYFMTMYASNAGKSGGEFFTPADVSELLTRPGNIGKKTVNKVYDPACGLGSLLLKAEFNVPVHPLEVQREIVRVLDSFTLLTARKKQYGYYRDELLSFE